MPLRCIASSFAFVLFFGLIGLFVIPSLIVYAFYFAFTKYPEDKFQYLASIIYKIFFVLLPRVTLEIDLKNDLPRSAIYISTHQSNLDYPILGSFIEKYIIMTKLKFKNIPFISLVGHLIGIRYLDISNSHREPKLYNEFHEALKNDRNVLFFAEGSRYDGVKLGKFKKGAFRLAFETKKPIVPIVLSGSVKILTKGNFCFSTTSKRIIRAKTLDPIYPDKFSCERDMLKYTQNLMQEQSDILNQRDLNV